MTADDFRELALSMQGAIERAHMGHPDFRANGRIFATLHADGQWGVVKLTPEEQTGFVRESPKAFVPVTGAWGRQGWTKVRLDSAAEAPVRAALIMAWERAAATPPSGSRAVRSRRTPSLRKPRP